MNRFEILLEEFDETLKKYNNTNYERLQPPLPNKKIESLLKQIGIVDKDVYTLYNWKNGVASEHLFANIFCFGCSLLSLENVLKYKTNNYLKNSNMDGLVILFDNQEECFLFNQNRGEDYGKLHLYSVPLLSIETPYSYFDSLASMLETTIDQYKNGGLVYDQGRGSLDENIEVNIEIYKKLNPLSAFYNRENW